jgi:uncharacterized coiled-coil protein SlyX
MNQLLNVLAASKKELDSLKEQMNELADKLSEKSRQYQKLQVVTCELCSQ